MCFTSLYYQWPIPLVIHVAAYYHKPEAPGTCTSHKTYHHKPILAPIAVSPLRISTKRFLAFSPEASLQIIPSWVQIQGAF